MALQLTFCCQLQEARMDLSIQPRSDHQKDVKHEENVQTMS